MPFNLRGGRPKNRGQGIYWVQRHVADQRRADRANRAALAFNERYRRIASNLEVAVGSIEQLNARAARSAKVARAIEVYRGRRDTVNADIEGATNGQLSRLATAAKNLIMACAAIDQIDATWDSDTKTLRIGGRSLLFG